MNLVVVASAAEVLGAMITPAVLLSASGTLVMSTSTRLVRVVDRVRALATEAEKLKGEGASGMRYDLIKDQLPRLSNRLVLLRAALSGLYLAIGLLVLTSLMVGFVQLFHWEMGNWLGIACGLLGTGALLYASGLLVREAHQAVASNLKEIEYLKRSI